MSSATLELISLSPEMTQQFGTALGRLLRRGHIVTLNGDLGAGKTTFMSGVGRGWGSDQPVTSPTFVIVHVHTRPADNQQLYHLDAYRLMSEADAESIGLDDILDASGAVFIEWAENIVDWLPPDILAITFDVDEENPLRRIIKFTATGTQHQNLLEQFSKQAVTDAAGN